MANLRTRLLDFGPSQSGKLSDVLLGLSPLLILIALVAVLQLLGVK